MSISKIGSNVNFRAVNYDKDSYETMMSTGSCKFDVLSLKFASVKGKDADMYHEPNQGYYLFTEADEQSYYLGKKPSVYDVIRMIRKINCGR